MNDLETMRELVEALKRLAPDLVDELRKRLVVIRDHSIVPAVKGSEAQTLNTFLVMLGVPHDDSVRF